MYFSFIASRFKSMLRARRTRTSWNCGLRRLMAMPWKPMGSLLKMRCFTAQPFFTASKSVCFIQMLLV